MQVLYNLFVNHIFTFKIFMIAIKNIKAPTLSRVTPPKNSFSFESMIPSDEAMRPSVE